LRATAIYLGRKKAQRFSGTGLQGLDMTRKRKSALLARMYLSVQQTNRAFQDRLIARASSASNAIGTVSRFARS